jgi:hypothetical protein
VRPAARRPAAAPRHATRAFAAWDSAAVFDLAVTAAPARDSTAAHAAAELPATRAAAAALPRVVVGIGRLPAGASARPSITRLRRWPSRYVGLAVDSTASPVNCDRRARHPEASRICAMEVSFAGPFFAGDSAWGDEDWGARQCRTRPGRDAGGAIARHHFRRGAAGWRPVRGGGLRINDAVWHSGMSELPGSAGTATAPTAPTVAFASGRSTRGHTERATKLSRCLRRPGVTPSPYAVPRQSPDSA